MSRTRPLIYFGKFDVDFMPCLFLTVSAFFKFVQHFFNAVYAVIKRTQDGEVENRGYRGRNRYNL
jgi:hypothetical protein